MQLSEVHASPLMMFSLLIHIVSDDYQLPRRPTFTMQIHSLDLFRFEVAVFS